ncbi:hypothetical protein ABIE85_001110 [Bradyrhizobium diazoefficiens]|uniref:hypothetical protein n=1 Tax=Bradyrhizobium diazoefficiens TaxID=1355477 RepID=UPI0035137235
MTFPKLRLAASLLPLALISASGARAADLPVKAPPPASDAPFFFVNDNRLTYAYAFTGSYPGLANQTASQVAAFTHFDAWT